MWLKKKPNPPVVQQVFAPVDPAKIRESLRGLREQLQVFYSLYDDLLEQYPDRWIAFHDGKVLASGDSQEAILAEVESQGMHRQDVLSEYLDTDPPKLWLQNT